MNGWTVSFLLSVVAVVGCANDDGTGDGRNPGSTDGDGGLALPGPDSGDVGPGGGDGGAVANCGERRLNDWEQMMLEAHNRWRNDAEPPAANMYRLYWDWAIVANAANWIASCDPDWPHSPEDTRRNIGGYEILGENLTYCGGPGCSESPLVTDGSGMAAGEGWWEERLDYDWETHTSSGLTSHYLHMMSSNVYAVGCATKHCGPPGPFDWDGDWWWSICQYGPRGQAYWSDTRPYDAGTGGLVDPPASLLEAHPSLCRPTE